MSISTYEMMIFITMGVMAFWVYAPLSAFLLVKATRFINDDPTPPVLPAPFFLGESNNNSWEIPVFGVCIVPLLSLAWPVIYLGLFLGLLLYASRFLVRCSKSISRLARVAHDHSGVKGEPTPTYIPSPKFTGEYK